MPVDRRVPIAAVSTILHVPNYGSVFQAYATQEILRSNGFQVKFVDYVRPDLVDPVRSAASRSTLARGPLLEFGFRSVVGPFMRRRARLFERFTRDRMMLTRPYMSVEDLVDNPPSADIYVTGSDQVWNSDYNKGGTGPYLLGFAPADAPRISFSASIGKESLSQEERSELKPSLEKYDWVSVREPTAKRLINSMGIDADCILDPTLLVEGRVWREMARPVDDRKGYVFVYNLFPRSGFSEAAAPVLEAQPDPVLVAQTAPFLPVIGGARNILPTPEEFLGRLLGASRVITDSFHATALCLRMGVPVSVVLPNRYSSRITDLLDVTDASDVIVGGGGSGGMSSFTEGKWASVHRHLDKMRIRDLAKLGSVLERVMKSD